MCQWDNLVAASTGQLQPFANDGFGVGDQDGYGRVDFDVTKASTMLRTWVTVILIVASGVGHAQPQASAATPSGNASVARHKAHPLVAPSQSLCSASEKKYFSCPVSHGRTVSVCGSRDPQGRALLQYRVGVPGSNPELMFPDQPSPPAGKFEFVESGSAKSSLLNLRFRSGTTSYVVYRYSGVWDEGGAGVAARIGAGPLRYTTCLADVEQKEFYDMPELEVSRTDNDFDMLVFPPQKQAAP